MGDAHGAGEDCLVGGGGDGQDGVSCHEEEVAPPYCGGGQVRTEKQGMTLENIILATFNIFCVIIHKRC